MKRNIVTYFTLHPYPLYFHNFRQVKNKPYQPQPPRTVPPEGLRLNKFLSYAELGNRRQTEQWIKKGLVKVNGKVETNPGFRVQATDTVSYEGRPVKLQERPVYVLINKPKNSILGPTDETGRKTVREMLGHHVPEQVLPASELDRHSAGLLLLTNDSKVSTALSDPKRPVRQVYHITLAEPIPDETLELLRKATPEAITIKNIERISRGHSNELGLELTNGSPEEVRNYLKEQGLTVEKLDRTYFAGLTKKDLPRTRFRFLTEREVIMLRHFS